MTNAGYDAGIAKHKKKERLAWTLKAALLRSKDLKLTALGALAEGRKLRDSITTKLAKTRIDPEEAVVCVVFARPDLSALVQKFPIVPLTPAPATEAKHAATYAGKLPIGFLVFIWDKEEEKIFGHARPLIVEDSRSFDLNAQAAAIFEQYIRRVVLRDGSN